LDEEGYHDVTIEIAFLDTEHVLLDTGVSRTGQKLFSEVGKELRPQHLDLQGG
jgi:hypothetical protein